DDARRPLPFRHRDPAGAGGCLDWLFGIPYGRGAMMRSTLLLSGAIVLALSACGSKPEPPQYGANPALPEPQRGLLPKMVVSRPAEWGDDRPAVPQGYTVEAIATDLKIPRQTLLLPNGDILVAEGSGGGAPVLRPKDF